MRVPFTIDITKARLAHLDWVFRTNRILDQGLSPPHDFTASHRGCELGIWLHGEARRKYGHSDQIRQLAMEHRRFHQAVDQMFHALHGGDVDKTRELLVNVSHMSKDIIYLLTLLELKLLEEQRRARGLFGILSFIDDVLTSNTNWLEQPKDCASNPSIELTYARLEHLRWSSTIYHSFRNFGNGAKLQTHNKCDFGIWLQRDGLQRYANMPEIHILEGAHKNYHTTANLVINNLRDRRYRQADEAYVDVQILSREIAWLLTVIEYRLAHPETSAESGGAGTKVEETATSLSDDALTHSRMPLPPVGDISPLHGRSVIQ